MFLTNSLRPPAGGAGPAILVCALLGALFISTAPAGAERLMVPSDAPAWQRVGAAILLYAHIGGGALGLLSGPVAILSPKGKPIHRAAGTVFFYSMLVCYAVGAAVAPALETGQRPNFVAGILSLYLLLSSWKAARTRSPQVKWTEYAGLALAILIAAMGAIFMVQGAQSPSGTIDGSPPDAFTLFLVIGTAAALGEIHVIVRGQIAGPSRIRRHLWRMCASLFIAAGSFFFGQAQLLPQVLVQSPLPMIAVAFPLVAIAIWLVLSGRPRKPGI